MKYNYYFIKWAEDFFTEENFNKKLLSGQVYDSYRTVVGLNNSYVSMRNFRISLKEYCKIKGYIFNPKEFLNDRGRITQRIGNEVHECFYIGKPIKIKDTTKPIIILSESNLKAKAKALSMLSEDYKDDEVSFIRVSSNWSFLSFYLSSQNITKNTKALVINVYNIEDFGQFFNRYIKGNKLYINNKNEEPFEIDLPKLIFLYPSEEKISDNFLTEYEVITC